MQQRLRLLKQVTLTEEASGGEKILPAGKEYGIVGWVDENRPFINIPGLGDFYLESDEWALV